MSDLELYKDVFGHSLWIRKLEFFIVMWFSFQRPAIENWLWNKIFSCPVICQDSGGILQKSINEVIVLKLNKEAFRLNYEPTNSNNTFGALKFYSYDSQQDR